MMAFPNQEWVSHHPPERIMKRPMIIMEITSLLIGTDTSALRNTNLEPRAESIWKLPLRLK